MIAPIGASLLEPYGVDDPEAFLSACDPFIVTVQFDEDGDRSAAIVKIPGLEEQISDRGKLEISGDSASAREGDYLILGDPDSVKRCLAAGTRDGKAGPALPPGLGDASRSGPPAVRRSGLPG